MLLALFLPDDLLRERRRLVVGSEDACALALADDAINIGIGRLPVTAGCDGSCDMNACIGSMIGNSYRRIGSEIGTGRGGATWVVRMVMG